LGFVVQSDGESGAKKRAFEAECELLSPLCHIGLPTQAMSTARIQQARKPDMTADHCFDRSGRERGMFWFSLACVATLFFASCRRDNGTNAESDPRTSAEASVTPKQTAAVDATESSAESSTDGKPPVAAPAENGQQLFARHCAACHGERGDGKGLAAMFLFPKPRDLRAGRFRLVSTANNVPTREDLHAVLTRGMPGSSMPPWAHLSEQERDALVDEVIRIRRDGAREAFIRGLKDDEGLTDDEIAEADVQQEIQDYVDEVTSPGAGTNVPDIQASTADAVARGKDVYAKFACIQCHGETGRGDGGQEMFDDEKLPTGPRDFTLGIFKGSHDPASLYRRIAYGMPGSPMPGSSTMTPEQMVDLVHYIRSLSSEEQRQAAVLKRDRIVAKRVDSIPQSLEDDAWARSEPVRLRLTPMWWRNDADPEFSVQAIHDGDKIAVRMTWNDDTADHHSLRSESFKDAVAMELYQGPSEPFLGMGDRTSPVDVWFWDADRQRGPEVAESEYPNAVVDVFPFSESTVAGPELDRPGARAKDQPDVSLPARAAGNQVVPKSDQSGGSVLVVAGPRTVTFRPPQSQLVRASGKWQDGRWAVVMTRSLSTPSEAEGVALEPGGRASVAFAVWDGSHRDRDGQKSFTVWQDLAVEP
jgi:DMSO reductase family type II enzyme heme b subunit